MKKIITVGEAMAMFIADEKKNLSDVERFTRSIAGAEVNVAIGLSRLGHEVTYISSVGNDPFGEYIKKVLKKEKIRTGYVTVNTRRNTGFQLKEKNEKEDPKVVYFRKNSAASSLSRNILKKLDLKEYDLLHITGIFPSLSRRNYQFTKELIIKAKKNGVLVTFDPNCRPVLWKNEEEMIKVTNEIAFMCDVIIPGYSEGKILTGKDSTEEIAQFYIDKGIKNVFMKYKKEKSLFFSKEGYETFPCFKVKVIDTVGAGDGFAVGVIDGLLNNLSGEEILRQANAIGAIQVTNLSDNEGLPVRNELERFITTHTGV
mgnify:FL=1